MNDELNNFPEGTNRKQVIDELIDHDDIREIVLKQLIFLLSISITFQNN